MVRVRPSKSDVLRKGILQYSTGSKGQSIQTSNITKKEMKNTASGFYVRRSSNIRNKKSEIVLLLNSKLI